MLKLRLKTTAYKLLEQSFREWLQALGYTKETAYYSPIYVRGFLHFLELGNHTEIKEISVNHVKDYFDYLSCRKNQRKDGLLSINYLKNNLGGIKRFSKYLRETKQINLETEIQLPKPENFSKTILTKEEIKQLYQSTDESLLGYRDRAMLSIYYGCGLRKNEGVELKVNDILFEKELIHVKKGKNYKERFVPMSPSVKMNLENYIYYSRAILLQEPAKTEALFVNFRGQKMTGSGIYTRMKQISKKSGITKEIGLHSLRHSIATHLLQNGMKLEFISQFLGHCSLETTQIYAHLINHE